MKWGAYCELTFARLKDAVGQMKLTGKRSSVTFEENSVKY